MRNPCDPEATPDDEPEPETSEAAHALARYSIDLTHATPEFWAALAAAQARVAPNVGKDGRNVDANYTYATGDAMIAAGRLARAEAGAKLGLLSSTTFVAVDPPARAGTNDGPGQWVSADVTVSWALGCSDGGYVRGVAETCAISSRRRPIDKAVAAADTYLQGFVERGLMRLSRAEETDDDVDRRETVDEPPPPPRMSPAERSRIVRAMSTLQAARRAAGAPEKTNAQLVAELLPHAPVTSQDAEDMIAAIGRAVEDLRGGA